MNKKCVICKTRLDKDQRAYCSTACKIKRTEQLFSEAEQTVVTKVVKRN